MAFVFFNLFFLLFCFLFMIYFLGGGANYFTTPVSILIYTWGWRTGRGPSSTQGRGGKSGQQCRESRYCFQRQLVVATVTRSGEGWLHVLPDTWFMATSCSVVPAWLLPSACSQQDCMPRTIVVPAGQRDPPQAETCNDTQGPGLQIQSLRLFSPPWNYIVLIILIIPVWDGMHRFAFIFLWAMLT